MVQAQVKAEQQKQLKQWLKAVGQSQDRAAFAKLFEHYVPLLRAYSLAQEPGATLVADDLAQEVMIKIWNKAASYNPSLANTNTWVFTLARNTRIDALRRNGRYNTTIDADDLFEHIEDEGPGPFQAAQTLMTQEAINAGLAQLPKEQADVLHKVYLQGRSHQQASEELRLPLGTIKSRIRLALKKMYLLMGGQ
ncbi:sigma-70 family RNA polymerase sigma factor [Gilvimarinus polysaccharolyticus]|uniref:sigma-70 family RNA polymerase sigma factor n=1 Tax=Gilvimarinus polysaccharolyticus TaxID=863921 RepID=UPI000673470A|nr:sigma-70 family RNA polymerase sigma factor [Gilvimarinus polysaccharolyticus]